MFSGADLENLTNEAALIAARTNQQVITWADFNEALDRITLGLRRGSLVPTEAERKILAFHESGHAVTFAAQPELGEIRKVTISPRGGAGGFMAPLGKEEMFLSRERFQAQLVVAFAGRVAEKRITGTLSSGASNDLKQATEIAKQMVLDLGMGGTEYVAWGSDQGPVFLGGEISRRTLGEIGGPAHGMLFERLSRETMTAMAHLWIFTPDNRRATQLAVGADWLRINLAATALGVGLQPNSQALQEYPEMADVQTRVRAALGLQEGQTLQMLGRLGYAPPAPPTPRWAAGTRIRMTG